MFIINAQRLEARWSEAAASHEHKRSHIRELYIEGYTLPSYMFPICYIYTYISASPPRNISEACECYTSTKMLYVLYI